MFKVGVIREFHPVGQGAFYSETFLNKYFENNIFRMVFDCGNDLKHNNKDTKDYVDNYVEKKLKGEIDLLFISHFHEDHIRYLIKYKGHYKVKNVVIPSLNDEEKYLLLLGFRFEVSDIDYDLYSQFIMSPHQFFETDNIIRIGGDNNNTQENVLITFNAYYELIYVKKCFVLLCDRRPIWQYIPYNFINWEDKLELYIEFLNYFEKIGLKERKPIEYVKDICNNKIEGISLKDLVLIYKKIPRDLNKLCIGVLSLPVNYYNYRYRYRSCSKSNISCLYTGDMPFKSEYISKIKEIISKNKFSKDVSINTVQIPHHGSGGIYFDESFFKLNFQNAVMCLGSENKYHHPSGDLLRTLALEGKKIKSITEYLRTKFVQRFIIDVFDRDV